MLAKRIRLNIFLSTTPALITVYTLDGQTIFSQTLTQQQTTFCFCCNKQKFAINANFNNQNQTQYFILSENRCQFFNVYFNFNNNQQIVRQNIILLDQNYNLPIKSATLTFQN